MKVAGPLVTLGAVAALGIGIYAVNVSKESQPAAPVPSTSQAAPPTSQAAPPIATTPAAVPFPAAADYQGKVETKAGVITLDISVKGAAARAYACDGKAVETWLSGPADAGVVNLTSKDKTSHLEGRHDGKSVAGTLTIGEKSWPFTAFAVQPPAGLYVSQNNGVRNSWIVGADKAVTGVQRSADGATSPAPTLTSDAKRVEGDSDGI
ncbi:hypothetical protein [Mycolicibacterium mucogenicum]|uniref:Uncharacterized protein n=1 Tax=Mycolicibacterium mucogenicum DSM 44124 TaxID=1226753 RepID=A0A8E4R4Z4_MYCMU|nr:hypothetical protein [Mycolicibacterium mucogenicum]QPG67856.1 hypothetical protein C1S78_020325 [Mycolicibacterium mucogenicum DSM 44124]